MRMTLPHQSYQIHTYVFDFSYHWYTHIHATVCLDSRPWSELLLRYTSIGSGQSCIHIYELVLLCFIALVFWSKLHIYICQGSCFAVLNSMIMNVCSSVLVCVWATITLICLHLNGHYLELWCTFQLLATFLFIDMNRHASKAPAFYIHVTWNSPLILA